MALWVCGRCGTVYAVGLAACPQCWCTDYTEDGVVPKITVADGPSNALLDDVAAEVVVVPDEAAAEDVPVLPDPPPVSAPKAEWVDHAVAVGAVPPDEAGSMTKAELVETVKVVAPDPQPAATPAPDSTPEPSSPVSSAPADAAT